MTATPAATARLDALIAALVACHRDGTLLAAADWDGSVRDEADAYAVQAGVAAALGWPLERWKSGGAGPQGPFSHSPVDPVAGGRLLGVEVEVALRVDAHGGPEAMCVAVELIASRWREGLDASPLLRFTDFQSNAGLRLGAWQAYRPLDWAQLGWRLELDGAAPLARRGGHAPADPAAVLPAWREHLARIGVPLRAGQVVTTGAWAGLHPLPAGAHGMLAIDGLGRLSF